MDHASFRGQLPGTQGTKALMTYSPPGKHFLENVPVGFMLLCGIAHVPSAYGGQVWAASPRCHPHGSQQGLAFATWNTRQKAGDSFNAISLRLTAACTKSTGRKELAGVLCMHTKSLQVCCVCTQRACRCAVYAHKELAGVLCMHTESLQVCCVCTQRACRCAVYARMQAHHGQPCPDASDQLHQSADCPGPKIKERLYASTSLRLRQGACGCAVQAHLLPPSHNTGSKGPLRRVVGRCGGVMEPTSRSGGVTGASRPGGHTI